MSSVASSVGAVGTTASSQTQNKTFATLDSQDFLKMLITQLTHQDPTEPMDNKEIMDQLSSLRAMEASQNLTDSLKALARQGGMGAAAGLIGRPILALADDGAEVIGLVTSALVTADGVRLVLSQEGQQPMSVKLDNVREIGQGGLA